jgi:glyoxylate reductase
VTGKIYPLALETIKQHCEVKVWADNQPTETLQEWLRDAEGLYNSGYVQITDAVLTQAPQLRVISQPSAGYDNVDLAACTAHGIPLGNTASALTETTADLAFTLLLAATRRITQGWDMVRNGRWQNSLNIPFGIDLYGKTLGIVGMGAIGSAVARRAQACGMKIIYHNRKPRPAGEVQAMQWVPFEQLLSQSDCIVVLTPLTAETRHLFNAAAFDKMKSSVHFINAARGAIVDTEALYHALANNVIAFAALDVTDPEPLPADHPLLSLPNILITPHVGSATPETRARMAMMAVDNLLAGLRGEKLPSCVNAEVNYRTDESGLEIQ